MSGAAPLRQAATPLVALALATGVGVAAPALLDSAARLGANVPQMDMHADYLVAWIWGLCIGASILFWPVPDRDRRRLLVLWGAKLVVALGFMLLYERNYALLDAYGYFRSARWGDLVAWDASDGTTRIVGLARLHPEPLRSSYHALKVTFALWGLVGVYLFYRAAVLACGRERPGLLLGLGLFPSVLFWSTILGKDPVMLAAVGLYALGAVGWIRTRRGAYLLALFAGTAAALAIRYWMGPILLLPVLPYLTPATAPRSVRALLVGAGLLVVALLVRTFALELRLAGLSDLLSAVGSVSQAWAVGGSAQQIPFDITSPGGFLAFLPLGAFTALFRPLPFDAHNAFAMLAGVENTLLLLLLAGAIARIDRAKLRDPIVRWAGAFVLIWSSLYGVLSYQNLGAAVRFKAQILPLLLLLLLYLVFHPGGKGGTDDAESASRIR